MDAPRRKVSSRAGEWIRFLRAFARRPAAVGALGPSSRFLANAMVKGCPLREADTVVELGPGTGAFTQAILSSIGNDTTFFALELSALFARDLKRRFPKVVVYNDSAEHLLEYLSKHEKPAADHIFCGLPWASLPLSVQQKVFTAILEGLRPGGTFSTFAYLHASRFPNASRFRRRLQERFSRVEMSSTVWRNVPPAFVYRCVR